MIEKWTSTQTGHVYKNQARCFTILPFDSDYSVKSREKLNLPFFSETLKKSLRKVEL